MRVVSMIASILLLLSLGRATAVPASAVGEPSLSAASAALYESNSGSFLYTRQANVRRPMASTTKIMTALVALETLPLDKVITIPAEAVGVEGSSLYLRQGERLTVEQLLYGLLLQSANDAATVIAIAAAGSVSAFSDMMNARVESLGLTDTHFMNPHGLDDPEHYTTAHDLALISAEAMTNETFRQIVATKKKTIPSSDGKSVRVLVNHNKLLRLCEDAVGVKTGFTKKSGRCLVGAAEKNGVLLITVTLDASSDWNDHQSLFRYGFDNMETRVFASAGEIRFTLPVVNGETDRVICVNSEALTAVLPKSSPEAVRRVLLGNFTGAPVREGEVLGTVEYLIDGKTVASSSLVALSSVPEIKYHKGLF